MRIPSLSNLSIAHYDIADKKRLQRVHRFLKSCAFALQGSVYAWYGNSEALRHFKKKLRTLINPNEDDVRGYMLKNALWLFGVSPFVEGVYFGGYPPHVHCALDKLLKATVSHGEALYELVNLLRHK